ncbi:MAG: 3-deoxy-7-phosphoheptulonate synthase [Oscillospiraceae bacterium]|jgi:3-deoxy-7-phosphoheptulonate synthase|nr:3-deoxy-7-phosphoheptulonate synthase [Oscillospiraceae bacterium]
MIIILKHSATDAEIEILRRNAIAKSLVPQDISSDGARMIGLAGDLAGIDEDEFLRHDCVDKVVRVKEPYKLAGRRFHPADSVLDIAGRRVGGGNFVVIAGPCSVESEDQILSVARDVKLAGASFLRGGAFKPRTSPYAFTGLGLDGLDLLKIAREKTGLPIVTEIMSAEHLDRFAEDVDVIQIGARNMQNYTLLRQVGSLAKPVLLKRGLSSTIDELLLAAEHVMAGGATDIMLCERGIRTFETATRNTLDLSAVPVLQQKTHLPVIIDPSHATGYWHLVEPMSLAAVAAGADGLIIEVHNQPELALCDGAQSVTPQVFRRIMTRVGRVREAISIDN